MLDKCCNILTTNVKTIFDSRDGKCENKGGFYDPSRFFFICILRPIKIISHILSRVSCKLERKWEILEKNNLTTSKQNKVELFTF